MKVKIIIALLLLSVRLFAQEKKAADSSFFFNIALNSLEASKQNATFLLRNGEDQISKVNLEYTRQGGNYKKSQSPGSGYDITFNADGIKKLNRFKLYGSFAYTKSRQQDLAYALRGEEIDDEPFYYLAGKAGDFARQKYHGRGVISYELIRGSLYLSSGFDYIYYLSDRSIDPRMSLNWFDLKARPELTFVTKKINIGIGAHIGYGTETTTIKYKNKDYSEGVLYPDRISYLNYGYGYVVRRQNNFSRRKQYNGASLHFSGSTGLWDGMATLDYLQSKEKNMQSLQSSLLTDPFSDYTSDKLSGFLLMTRKYKNNVKQVEASYSHLAGDDYVYDLLGKNYMAKNTHASLSFRNSDTYGKRTFEWGMSAAYTKSSKRDIVSAHFFEYSNIQPGLHAAYYLVWPDKSRFSIGLAPSVILPMKTDILVPVTQETEFTRGVVYPDYAYRLSTSGMLNLNFRYINTTLSKTFRTGIEFNSGLVKAFNKPEINFTAYSLPGDYRYTANLSLNLYF
ncbi:DUF6850 family outer membrane beta-barrel protein [Pedobacter nutrimenti]|uniref:DUF6850 domain-containing protein n=1 Tax=Pedobacter nutrimenti TaxID=1241337 RepID=A0A318U9Q2_9SPHI|nr:DUF6850 family outer membrane beta-barrel protein [Pedobacter nutrimenti]PYF71513.1 hypothetical protein B0O44_107128 [Pedobacter nutrimenti]